VTDGAELAVAFARVLRSAGVPVPTSAVVAFAEAAAAVGVGGRDGVYWAGRATLVRRPEDRAPYDRAFDAFWSGGATEAPVEREAPPRTAVLDDPDGCDEADAGEEGERVAGADVVAVRYSAVETLRHQDLATCTPAEREEAYRLMAGLPLDAGRRRSRRERASRSTAGAVDLRRTLRRSIRAGGEPVVPARRRPGERPRPVVLLLDISGSMEPYARALLRFAHVAVVARARVEVFTLGTRLTRVTRELSSRDPDAALTAAGAAVADWSGGTRLGEVLGEFCDRWGVPGMARGAVVVVLSDGWDRGEATHLGAQMARLARVAHRIVWVNPLKASPGYAPLAAGMAAALPHVDDFVEGHSLASLEALAHVLGGSR
jgi:uncharacterized protein